MNEADQQLVRPEQSCAQDHSFCTCVAVSEQNTGRYYHAGCGANLIKFAEREAGDKARDLACSPCSQMAQPLRTGLAWIASTALHRGPGNQQASPCN